VTLDVQARTAPTGVAEVRVRGELDLDGTTALRERLRPLRDAGTPTRIDLSAVTLIDSTGLRVLLDVAHDVEEHDWDCRVVAASPIVRRAARLTGVAPHLPFRARRIEPGGPRRTA
jgi:anti-anti-sigma factor